MLCSDIVLGLSDIHWLELVLVPEFEEVLGESEGSSQVIDPRRDEFIGSFQ